MNGSNPDPPLGTELGLVPTRLSQPSVPSPQPQQTALLLSWGRKSLVLLPPEASGRLTSLIQSC